MVWDMAGVSRTTVGTFRFSKKPVCSDCSGAAFSLKTWKGLGGCKPAALVVVGIEDGGGSVDGVRACGGDVVGFRTIVQEELVDVEQAGRMVGRPGGRSGSNRVQSACTRYGTRKEHVTELRAGALV